MHRRKPPWLRPGLTVAVLLLLVAPPLVRAQAVAELVIVAHAEVPASRLENAELEHMYLGKLSRWDGGLTVVPTMLKAGPAQEEFVEDYLDRPLHRFATYWRQMVFTGKGVPPLTFADEAELLDFVTTTPGAVGYVRPGTDTGAVKVLRIDR